MYKRQLALNNFNSDKLSSYSHETNELNFKGYNWVTDNFSISYHGHTHSHIDALNHLSHNGLYYNQLKSPDELGVENLKNGILTKAILIDLPLLKGKEFVEAGYKISVKDIIEFKNINPESFSVTFDDNMNIQNYIIFKLIKS